MLKQQHKVKGKVQAYKEEVRILTHATASTHAWVYCRCLQSEWCRLAFY